MKAEQKNRHSFPAVRADDRRRSRIDDDAIIAAYEKCGNVWKVGELFGIAGQTVFKHLKKRGAMHKMNHLTDEDKQKIVRFYAENDLKCGDGKLEAFAKSIGRTKQFICRYAGTLGLTHHRKPTQELAAEGGKKRSLHIAKFGHPKGMLGKKHTEAVKMYISEIGRDRWAKMSVKERAALILKRLKGKHKKGNLYTPRPQATWKSGWREIGGIRKYYRSKWEANYARVLEFQRQQGLIVSWAHESKTFWFEKVRRGTRSYLPDFEVVYPDGHTEYHEVKGWYDKRSQTKTKRMAKYYPDVKLRMIMAKEYNAFKRQLRGLIPDWE